LADGDHVVLLGGTFIERAQSYGHLETMLAAAAGNSRVTFRNLGWSDDTVSAESRGIFDTPQKGYERMIEHIRAEEPTVIMVSYGQNEAMSGAEKPATKQFGERLVQLHRDLQSTGARFAFVSAHPLLYATPPIPSPNRFDPAIEEYAVEMQRVARELDVTFVDLFSDFPDALGRAQAVVAPDVAFTET
jgi:lysophospholipase L1-like esterase